MIRRLLTALAAIWLAATFAFFALRVLPGDAVTTQLRESGASLEVINSRRAALGLDQPIPVQYGEFLAGLTRGDLGISLQDGRAVSEIITQQLAPTLALAVSALLVAAMVGVILGTVAALDSPSRLAALLASLLLDLSLSLPVYWVGTVAIYVVTMLAIQALSPTSLTLPALVLGFSGAGAVGQVVRANVRETLKFDFVRTARAKGLSELRVLLFHILRASLIPVVSVLALQAGFLLGGVVITESLFVRPGIGRVLLNATLRQDYPLVQGIVVLGAVVYIIINFAADMLDRLLDPRV